MRVSVIAPAGASGDDVFPSRTKGRDRSERHFVVLCSLGNLVQQGGGSKLLILEDFGAGDGTRTRDVQLGKLAFYH